MAFLVSSHDECLEDVYSVLKQAELRAIVKDYTGTITSYKKVKNGFLEAMYKLKKQEYISKYGVSGVKETKLIHSTAVNNVFGIIKDNFDWRRVIRNKYGNGVSFSDDADYANCHSNRSNGSERAFIIAKVLRAKETFGFPGLRIPSMECDTTIGNHVYVKYRDNEFLPKCCRCSYERILYEIHQLKSFICSNVVLKQCTNFFLFLNCILSLQVVIAFVILLLISTSKFILLTNFWYLYCVMYRFDFLLLLVQIIVVGVMLTKNKGVRYILGFICSRIKNNLQATRQKNL